MSGYGGVCPGAVCPWGGGVCPGGLPIGGGVCPGGCLPKGGVCPWGCLPRGCIPACNGAETSPVNRITDRCKNITLSQTSLGHWECEVRNSVNRNWTREAKNMESL